MGYDLTSLNGGEYFRFSIHSWKHVLALAEHGGWKPLGTQKLNYDDWQGTYRSNDGQIVTSVDALGIANGIEAILDDIPDHRTAPNEVVYASAEVVAANPDFKQHQIKMYKGRSSSDEAGEITCLFNEEWERGTPAPTILIVSRELLGEYDENSLDYFSGNGKNKLREFIEFCRLGAFEIR